MRKLIIVLLVISLSSFVVFSEGFMDVEDHWSESWVNQLIDYSITSGYPDGTFKPDNTITVEEYITFTVKALQSTDADKYKLTSSSDYWSDAYIDIAIKGGIISENEFSDLRRPIKREEMSSITINAYALENIVTQSNINTILVDELHDYHLISDQYIDNTLMAVREGFITGKSKVNNKTIVDPQGTATRGEAAVLLIKLLENDKRTPFPIDVPSTTFKSTKYNGAIKEKVDVTYYAAKNTEGEYVTEVFDIQHYFEQFDHNRIDANFSYQNSLLSVDFKALDKYEEYYTGSFWNFERNDIMFTYDEKQYEYDAKPYSLNMWNKGWHTEDYNTSLDYLKAGYGEQLEYMFSYFFEDDADIALNTYYSSFVNNIVSVDYEWNGRKVNVWGNSGFVGFNFTEQTN